GYASQFEQAGSKMTKEAEGELKQQREMEEGKRPIATLTPSRAAVENVAGSLIDATASIAKWIGITSGYIGDRIGVDTTPDDNTIHALGRFVEAKSRELFPADPARQKEFTQELARGAG